MDTLTLEYKAREHSHRAFMGMSIRWLGKSIFRIRSKSMALEAQLAVLADLAIQRAADTTHKW